MSSALELLGSEPSRAEVVHTPESPLRNKRRFLALMFRELAASRDLAWRLFVRDVRTQYRQSILGYVWAFVPAIVLTISLTLANQASLLNVPVTGVPYPVFVLVGTILWQTFLEAINGPLQAVTAAKPLLARISFPYEAIILAKLGDLLFNLLFKLALVAAMLLAYQVPLGWWVLAAPAPILVLILVGTALGLFLAPLGGLYDDVGRALALVLGAWFLMTPVVYERAAEGSLIDWANLFNPATAPLVTARELLTTGIVSRGKEFLIVSLLALPLLLLGWAYYRFALPFVIERISA